MAEFWAWVVEEEDGREGLVSGMVPFLDSGPIPFIGARKATVEAFRELAQAHHVSTGRPVRLYRFTQPEIVEELI